MNLKIHNCSSALLFLIFTVKHVMLKFMKNKYKSVTSYGMGRGPVDREHREMSKKYHKKNGKNGESFLKSQ